MKIDVNKEAIATATLDVKKFKAILTKDLDIDKAIYASVETSDENAAHTENTKKLIIYGTNWGQFLSSISKSKLDKVEFTLYRCVVEGFVTYKPGRLDTGDGSMTMEPEEKTWEDIIVTNDLSPRIDSNVEVMLSQYLIDYVNHKWTIILDYTRTR